MDRPALPVTAADVRDADLLAQLAQFPHGFGRDTMVRMLAGTQAKRDAERARLASLSPTQRKREEARSLLGSDAASAEHLRHIHSVLAICGLPYTRPLPNVRRYERSQGRMSLLVEAGELKAPTGEWLAQPLPYGTRARFLLLHLCSEAVRQKSATIEIADSLSAFIRSIGFPVTGGPRGTINAFKAQLNALAACRMTIGVWDGNRSSTIKAEPFESLDVWFPENPDQRMLWPSRIKFSGRFYETLAKHALPVNVHAIRHFANSPRKLDVLFWLGLRLNSLRKPTDISWAALKDQFGEGFTRDRAFRERFVDDIAHFRDVFPKLPLRLTEDGLHIEPADPSLLAIPAKASRKV